MCGRYTLRTPADVLVEVFDLAPAYDFALRYNIAPTQDVPSIIRDRDDGARHLMPMHWGLVPFWAKEPSLGGRMINARAESVSEKPAFRQAFLKRRCLIPTDGYYEWQKVGKRKQPYYFHRVDDCPFAFAGLWELWKGVDPPLRSCTIITTDANDLAREFHDRMPVILHASDYDQWLDPQNDDVAGLKSLLVPWTDNDLRADPVSTHVNNVRHDDPSCMAVERSLFE